MNRIVIIGSGGSGKSTLARNLGEKLKKEVYHLDALFWKPNWTGVPKEEQIKIQNNLVEEAEWIIDGNYGGTMDIRLDAADTIIFLDMPRLICVYRIVKRLIKYRNKTRPDMGKGCPERFSLTFLKWIWKYPTEKRPSIIKKLNLYRDKNVIIIKSSKEVKCFLDSFEYVS